MNRRDSPDYRPRWCIRDSFWPETAFPLCLPAHIVVNLPPAQRLDVIDLHTHLSHALEGRYVLEGELGRGGMATVWRARDLRHQRYVALKVLHPELAAGLGPERFLREVQLAARLQHPHILPVFDSGAIEPRDKLGELLWYTMPFIDGESLRSRVEREVQLPLEEALRLTREVAEALEYAHEQGVIHRDIKPENILLSRGHALLADFGIARALDPGETGTLTGTGVAIGTPVYMSPEQAMGERGLDGRSDVYSLGCVFYEMIAGQPPHAGPTPQALVAKRLLDPVPEIERCRPGIPAVVRTVVRRALATMAVDRYPTAGDFARALAAAENTASTAETPSREHRSKRRNLAKVVSAAIVVALVLVVLVWGRQEFQAVAPSEPLRLAVLPFETLGDSARDYLTDGIAEGLRGKLARLQKLQVIAGSSTEEYRRTRKPFDQIGRELGVPYVLVGSVRWDQDRGAEALHVRPKLIHTRTGTTRALSSLRSNASGVPQLQTALALGVTEALGVELDQSERARLSDTITTNPEAYAAYLRGRDYHRRVAHYDAPAALLRAAVELFERAIALDSTFALAKVGLAEVHRMAGFLAGGDAARYRVADSLLEVVLQRWPDLPEALAARGDIRRDHEQLDAASKLYERAVALKPGDAGLLARLTFLQGLRLDSTALRTGARAVSLAPRDPEILRRVIAGTSIFRDYDELARYSDRLIALDPSDVLGYVHKALAGLMAQGDTVTAVRALRTAEEMQGKIPFVVAWVFAMCGPSGWQWWHRLTLDQLASPTLEDTLNYFWYQAQIAAAEGRSSVKRAYADSIVAVASRLRPETPNYGYQLAIVSYGETVRGNRAKGRRDLVEAEAALRKMSPSGQAMLQVTFVSANAELGDINRAVAGTRWLLEEPTPYTKHIVRLSPEFARLWRSPQFEQLMKDPKLP